MRRVHILHYSNLEDLDQRLTGLRKDPNIIPLSLWTSQGQLEPILQASGKINYIENAAILYLGKSAPAEGV